MVYVDVQLMKGLTPIDAYTSPPPARAGSRDAAPAGVGVTQVAALARAVVRRISRRFNSDFLVLFDFMRAVLQVSAGFAPDTARKRMLFYSTFITCACFV